MREKNLVEDIYPLSPLQGGILFHALEDPEGGAYFTQETYGLEGEVSAQQLRSAAQALVDRHPVLRTAFFWEGREQPVQVVLRRAVLPWVEEDWQDVSENEQQARLESFLREDRSRGFQLKKAPLMRLALFRTAPDRAWLVWSHHHLLLDGWSLNLLLEEMALRVAAAASGEESPGLPAVRPFGEYIAWLKGRDEAAEEAYWRRALAGFRQPTPLPVETVAPEAEAGGESYPSRVDSLSPEQSLKLQTFMRRHRLTLSTLAQGAWGLLLALCGGRRDVVFGAPVSGRPADLDGVEEMIGLFINTLPVRLQVSPADRVLPWLQSLQEQQLEAREHDSTPLREIQNWTEISGRAALFETLVVVENYPGLAPQQDDPGAGGQAPGLRVTSVRSRIQANYPLALTVAAGEVVELRTYYDPQRFDEETVAELQRCLQCLLTGFAAAPQGRVLDLPLVPEERVVELRALGAGGDPVAPEESVLESFEALARAHPEAPAVVCGEEELTYGQLDRAANRLARALLQTGDAETPASPLLREEPVGLCLPRSEALVVGLLAVLKAGGAYLVLEPEHPARRRRELLEEVGARRVITEAALAADFDGLEILCTDRDAGWIAALDADAPAPRPFSEGLAYVLFTSGSTGRPKGVGVEHRQLAAYTAAAIQRLQLEAGMSYALVSTPAADLGNTSIFGALITGGCLHLLPREQITDAGVTAEYLHRRGIDVLKITPSHLKVLLAAVESGAAFPRRRLVLGGEASTVREVEAWRRQLPAECRVFNHYGPTETTVGVAAGEADELLPEALDGLLPLGRPLGGCRLAVVAGNGAMLPSGALGELAIGGATVTRGYLGRPAQTAERFRPDPYGGEPGARCYRSGDRASLSRRGVFRFRGRTDHQLKVRGFRVELGEIEARLRSHPEVGEVAVVALPAGDDGKRLVAYYTASGSAAGFVGDDRYRLGDGTTVEYLNASEVEYLHREIFLEQGYLRHGVEIPEQGCVIDAGANIGMFSLFAAQRRPKVEIYAFEPLPPTFGVMRRNLQPFASRVHVLQEALGGEDGEADFTFFHQHSALSGLAEVADPEAEAQVLRTFLSNQKDAGGAATTDVDAEVLAQTFQSETYRCPVRRLSSVIRDRHLERIGLLKVDVQRAELELLAGIDEEHWARIDQLVLEIHDPDAGAAGGPVSQVREMLLGHGFEVALEQDTALAGTDRHCLYARRGALAEASEEPVTEAATDAAPDAAAVSPATLQSFLEGQLPDYMVPSQLIPLESLPLNPNGKVDRSRLPDPESAVAGESGLRAPVSALEEELVALWKDLLKIDQLGVDQDFFDLGGHSLRAMQLITRVRKAFEVRLSLQEFLAAPTVTALAERITELRRPAPEETEEEAQQEVEKPPPADFAEAPIPRRPDPAEPCVLSHAQERLWLAEQLDPGTSAYNVPAAVRLEGGLEPGFFLQAVAALVERHEVLRTRFPQREGAPVQEVMPPGLPAVAVVDLQGLVPEQRLQEARRLAHREANYPFDLAQGPLLRLRLLLLGPADTGVLLTLHHIVCDAWSMELVLHELVVLYQSRVEGRSAPLEELPVQYADFALWQRDRLDEATMDRLLAYWTEQLAGTPEATSLPLDHPRSEAPTSDGREEMLSLPPEVLEPLLRLGREEGCTDFMVVLTLLKGLLYGVSGDDDLCVGANAAYRGHLDAEPLVGFFVNQVVLRSRPQEDETFRSFLRQVRSTVAEAFEHQELPFETLVHALRPRRASNLSPLFQVKIDYRDDVLEQPDLEGLEVTDLDPEAVQAHFDLSLIAERSGGGLEGALNYRAELFEPGTVREMARAFEALAAAAAEDPDQPMAQLREGIRQEMTRQRDEQRSQATDRGRRRLRAVRRKSIRI